MTGKARKARDAVVRRKMAHLVASWILILQEIRERRPTADEWERYLGKATSAWQRCILTNLDDPAAFLSLVVIALQGKLRGKTYDSLLIKALAHARNKVRARPGQAVQLTRKQFDNALTIVSGRGHRPTITAAVRRLKQLHPQVSFAE